MQYVLLTLPLDKSNKADGIPTNSTGTELNSFRSFCSPGFCTLNTTQSCSKFFFASSGGKALGTWLNGVVTPNVEVL